MDKDETCSVSVLLQGREPLGGMGVNTGEDLTNLGGLQNFTVGSLLKKLWAVVCEESMRKLSLRTSFKLTYFMKVFNHIFYI